MFNVNFVRNFVDTWFVYIGSRINMADPWGPYLVIFTFTFMAYYQCCMFYFDFFYLTVYVFSVSLFVLLVTIFVMCFSWALFRL